MPKKELKNIFTLFILFCLFYSCTDNPEKINYIARVEDSYLTEQKLLELLPEAPPLSATKTEMVKSLISNWTKKQILYQKAQKYHFDEDRILKSRAEDYFKDLVIDAYLKYNFQSNVNITEQEIRDYYFKNKKSFVRTAEEAKITHIVVNDYEKARTIKSTLRSYDRNKKNRLFSQYDFETKIVRKGQSVNELDKTIFETKPRHILGPIASDYGYHVIEVLERYSEGSIRPIKEVRDEIFQHLTQMKIQNKYILLLDSLMSTADYEIREDKIFNMFGN